MPAPCSSLVATTLTVGVRYPDGKWLLDLVCNAFVTLRFVNPEDDNHGLDLADKKHAQGRGFWIPLQQHLISSHKRL